MSKAAIKVEIPMLPPKELNPNARVHWSVKALYTNQYRAMAKFSALEATRYAHPSYSQVRVSITLVVPDRRHIRDTDNLLASVKPAVDGCVDAGIVQDDSPGYLSYDLPVSYKVDKKGAPLTVLEFREVE